MFIPTTKQEMKKLGWDSLDVILITGDTYIDSPFVGIAIIGKLLIQAGYKTGIIAQPDINSDKDISRLGEPSLLWGVTGGCVDSMVANYTAVRKKRKQDDFTPGGINNRRPDRAVIVYTNLVRRFFKKTAPVVLGGIEASLRRIAHYDYWSDSVRKSILVDSGADILVYGMAEKTIIDLAECLQEKEHTIDIRGVCFLSPEPRREYIELPSYKEVSEDKQAFTRMFTLFHQNSDPLTARGLCQKHDKHYLIHNPPATHLSQKELDRVYDSDFEREAHPFYGQQGKVKALDTIRFSIPTHRGCYGECNFCAITVHEGRTVRWRSKESIVQEAQKMTRHPRFRGIINDVGGPTANMYGFECPQKLRRGSCRNKKCLYPEICSRLPVNHSRQTELLRALQNVKGVKKVFVASGIRYDLLLHDKRYGFRYLQEIVRNHVSGQLKIAPEHTEDHVLKRMGKPGYKSLLLFIKMFLSLTDKAVKSQYLTYYLMAAHPGCTIHDMEKLKTFTRRELKCTPEQVQIFTPTPSTYSTVMYYTEKDPFSGQPLFVEKKTENKERQKNIIVTKEHKKHGKK